MEKLKIKRANRLMLMLFKEWRNHTNEDRPLKIEWNIMHLFSSVQIAKIYAVKYKLDPELCAIIAALHDIATVEGKIKDDHDKLAEKYVLGAIQRYNDGGRYKLDPITESEIEIILKAVTVHSDKATFTDNPYTEMMKDVDSLDRYLHGIKSEGEYGERVEKVLEEFNI